MATIGHTGEYDKIMPSMNVASDIEYHPKPNVASDIEYHPTPLVFLRQDMPASNRGRYAT
jgi:hypothetical protein